LNAFPPFARALIAPGAVAVALMAAMYCVFDRSTAEQDLGVWAIVARVAVSRQFLTYVVIPVWFAYCITVAERSRKPAVLMRIGTFARAWVRSLTCSLRALGSGALLVTVTLVLACAGLTQKSAPLEIGLANAPSRIAAPVLVLGEIALLFVSLLALQSVLLVLGVLTGRRWPTVALAVSIWIWMIASTIGAIGTDSAANADRYFDVFALLMFGSWSTLAITVGATAASCALVVIGLDRRYRQAAIALLSGRAIFVAAALIVSALWAAEVASTARDMFDAVTVAFIGNGGTVFTAIVLAFFGVGYGYAAQLRWMEIAQLRDLQLLRYGTRARRSAHVLGREAVAAVVYVVVIDAVAIASSLAASKHPFASADVDLGPWLFQLLANGVLIVWMNVTCFFVAVEIFQRPAAVLRVGLALFVLGVAWPFHSVWYPFGAASMARAELGWPGVLSATAAMCGVTLAALLSLGIHIVVTSRPRRKAIA
jgi:hypothetical protein